MTIKITIIEGDSSDLLPILVLLAKGGRTPASPFASPLSEGFRVGTLEDLFQDLRETPTRQQNPLRHIDDLLEILNRKGSGEGKPEGGETTGDDTPPDEPQGSEREPEGTAETPEDTRLRFYVQHEGED